ncbi:MAG: response regulator [Lachnospira eligens]
MRILLVEDDRSLSRAVSTILQKNNYSVDCAGKSVRRPLII